MKYIYLATQKWSPESAIIRYGTRSPWSHAGFFDSESQGYLSAQLNGGVQWRYLWGHGDYQERMSTVTYLTADGVDAAFGVAASQIGARYDWKAILGIAADKDWHTGDDYFCSELVAYSFEQIGKPLVNPNTVVWRITPRDILLSPMVRSAVPEIVGR